MITRLSLSGFMAHADTVLDLAPGLNVLTGPNNTGKSAVVEALRCLAQNPPPRHVIRHGAAEARVTVTLDDGTTVAWVRRPKYALYELTRPGEAEPETFAKFGRVPPEAIRDVLRLDTVPLEIGEPVDVHLGDQRRPIFLLDQPGTAAAGFFAASCEAAHLIAMQNRLTDRTRKAKTEARRHEARLGDLAGRLDRLAPLPDLEHRLSGVDALETALTALGRAMPALADVLARGTALRRETARLTRRETRLAALAAPPAPVETAPLAGLLDRRALLAAARDHLGARRAVLSALAAPPVPEATGALAGLAAALEKTRGQRHRVETRAAVLDRLAEPPVPAETAALAETGARLLAVRAAANALAARSVRLAGLPEPPDIADPRPLAEATRAIAATRAALAAALAACREKTQALARAEARIAARLAELGACPLCGSRLSAAAFLGLDAPTDAREDPA